MKNIRVQVSLSDSMVSKVDDMASNMGVSRSALCSMIIGQYMLNQEKAMDVLKAVGYEMVNDSK